MLTSAKAKLRRTLLARSWWTHLVALSSAHARAARALAVLLGIGAGLGVALASASSVQPMRLSYGGHGGGPAAARCPAGSYVSGLRVFMGDSTVAGVALTCRRDAAPHRPIKDRLLGQRTAHVDGVECDHGWVAVGIWGGAGQLVDRLSLMCAARGAIAGPVRHLRAAGGTGGGSFRAWCPAGQALTGLSGAAGALLDRVAPVCGAPHE